MRVPTISRARDLIASLIAAATLEHYGTAWDGSESQELPLAPLRWMLRPDPSVTRNFLLAWTFDDLLFHGRATWGVTSRYADGYPSAFTWLPHANLSYPDQAGPVWYGPSPYVDFNGTRIPGYDLVQFLSPIESLLSMGTRAVLTARRLDSAAERFATNDIPAGWLRQTGGEPMSGEDLAELAAAWSEAREENTIGALSQDVEWVESSIDPSKLQLTEARSHQALELARVANIPPYMVGAPAGTGMTYLNAEQARADLVTFGARPFLDAIEQTLSGDNVLPQGRYVRLGLAGWLRNPLGSPSDTPAPTPSPQENPA